MLKKKTNGEMSQLNVNVNVLGDACDAAETSGQRREGNPPKVADIKSINIEYQMNIVSDIRREILKFR